MSLRPLRRDALDAARTSTRVVRAAVAAADLALM
jgi:hypothetical protein